jgi:D-alanyl-D-alanine carboxypeptidase
LIWPAILFVVASCANHEVSSGSTTSTSQVAPTGAGGSTLTSVVSAASDGYPIALFAGLSDDAVSDELAAELQTVLDASANGHGLTATVIGPNGTWSGATGMATTERAMSPNDQMAIASITKTIVAAQVMRMVETGELRLDDLAADHLPPDLKFDSNGARIIDLLSMRSGIPGYFPDEAELEEVLTAEPLRIWTLQEKLATVASDRGPVGQDWEYVGTNYLLLASIIEQVSGRTVAEVLRGGVLAGSGYERLIYQPDERPTEPMAFTVERIIPAATFARGGGYLPSLAVATMFDSEGGMASDSMSLARWFRQLCAGQVVSPTSLADMTDFVERPGYGLGVIDRSSEYWPGSGALGHTGGNVIAVALCFRDPVSVVVVLANAEHDLDTVAGDLVQAASG